MKHKKINTYINKDIRDKNRTPQTYSIWPEGFLVNQKRHKPSNRIYTLLGCYAALVGS